MYQRLLVANIFVVFQQQKSPENNHANIFFTDITKAFCSLLGSLPGNAGQIMKALNEESGTPLPQKNEFMMKVCRKIRQ